MTVFDVNSTLEPTLSAIGLPITRGDPRDRVLLYFDGNRVGVISPIANFAIVLHSKDVTTGEEKTEVYAEPYCSVNHRVGSMDDFWQLLGKANDCLSDVVGYDDFGQALHYSNASACPRPVFDDKQQILLSVISLLNHQADGDGLIKSLKARGFKVRAWKITELYDTKCHIFRNPTEVEQEAARGSDTVEGFVTDLVLLNNA